MNTVLAELWEEKHESPDGRARAVESLRAVRSRGAGWSRADHGRRGRAGRPARGGDRRMGARRGVLVDCLSRDPRRRHAQRGVGSPGGPARSPSTCTTSGLPHADRGGVRSIAGSRMRTVLRFTRDRYDRRVYAVKGRAGESPIWPRKPSRKNQTPFFMVGVDAAKTAIYDRLKIREAGAGLLPLPDRARPGVLRAVDRREEVHALSQRVSETGMAEAGQRPERRLSTRGSTLTRRCTRCTRAD